MTRIDRIRNQMLDVLERKSETRPRWFGHVQRRDSEYIGRRMMRLELTSRSPRGGPKIRFMDVVKVDMKEDAEDRVRWKQMIHCCEP